MNSYSGHIVKIETVGPLSMVAVSLSDGVEISAIVLEAQGSASYLQEGSPIWVLFKETEVILATGPADKIGPYSIMGLLMPVDESMANATAVQSDSWGHIKASVVDLPITIAMELCILCTRQRLLFLVLPPNVKTQSIRTQIILTERLKSCNLS